MYAIDTHTNIYIQKRTFRDAMLALRTLKKKRTVNAITIIALLTRNAAIAALCWTTRSKEWSRVSRHTHLVIRVQLVFARTIKTAHEKFKWPASPPPHYNSKTKQQKISLLPHQTINWMQCGRSVWWSHFHISRDSFLNPFVVVVIFASSSGLFFLMYNICFLAIRCVNVYTCGQRNRNSECAFMMNDFYNNNNKTVTGNLSSDPQKHTS